MKFQNVCIESLAVALPEEIWTSAQIEERLRPRWMYQWQTDPAAIYPGTTMTVYDFKPIFGGNQKDGVNAAVEYLLNFSNFMKSTSNK